MSAVAEPLEAVEPRRGFLARLRTREGYIVSPVYDLVFFIGSPTLALGLGALLGGSSLATQSLSSSGKPLLAMMVGTLTMGHLFIVFFRSHGNREIFKLYPYRFTVVPALLVIAFLSSGWARAFGTVLAALWDVYHSSLQTFGFGRIYDRLAGNGPEQGRRLDVWLNHLLYVGPAIAGVTFLGQFDDAFYSFDTVGSAFFTTIPAYARTWHSWLALGVIAVGVPFLVYYVLSYVDLARRGYRVSFQKVALLASTGLCSIWAWGFGSFGVAFLVMNLFHAVQYFAIVGFTERNRIASHLPWGSDRFRIPKVAVILLACGLGYGLWAELARAKGLSASWAFAVVTTVALLHFWYDGFIWSVRKKQV